MTSGYMPVLFISIRQMPFLAPTHDNVDLLFALVITQGALVQHQGFYLHHVEVADQDSASGSLYKQLLCKLYLSL